jgi:hypothetical protein
VLMSRKPVLGWVGIGVIVGLIVGGGAVVAAIPDSSSGKITACYATRGADAGVLRVIDGGSCGRGERQVSWSSQGLRWRGVWSSTKTYQRDDMVTLQGSTYAAVRTPASGTPGSAPRSWALLAQRGPQGPEGDQGPQGTPGATGPQGAPGIPGQSPVEIATWNYSYEPEPGDFGFFMPHAAATEIPVGDQIQGLSGTLTGDFSACAGGAVRVNLGGRADPGINSGYVALWFIDQGVISGGATNEVKTQAQLNGWKTMEISADCFPYGGFDPFFPMPAFDLSVTFRWTRTPPQVTFD